MLNLGVKLSFGELVFRYGVNNASTEDDSRWGRCTLERFVRGRLVMGRFFMSTFYLCSCFVDILNIQMFCEWVILGLDVSKSERFRDEKL